jgi:DCN1-like protein 1/2
LAEGIFLFASDIGIDPMKVDLLVVFWKLNCQKQYTMSKSEFIDGFNQLKMTNLTELKKGIPLLKNELSNKTNFNKFYKFVFNYSKTSPNAKVLPMEIAVPTWRLLLEGRYERLNDWCTFMQDVYQKAVSKDVWNELLPFMNEKNLAELDEERGWPIPMEEFAKYLKTENKL